jgi:hypothetical protein
MYAVMRKYDLTPETGEEFIQQVQKSLVPILNQLRGLKAYYVVEAGDDQMAVITVFERFADAKEAARQTAAWIAEYTPLFFQGFSEIVAGQVRVPSEPARLSSTGYQELLQGTF